MQRYTQFRRAVWFGSPVSIAFLIALVLLTLYLLIEHTAHVFAFLPFGIILLCPLMHLFMMRGMHSRHSGHVGHGNHSGLGDEPPRS